MVSFIFRRQPKAYQGSKTFKSDQSKTNYKIELERSAKEFNDLGNPLEDDLYGVVYYFQKKETGTDADNISKPIWDCLKGILFVDDKKVRLRIAGIINTSTSGIDILDVSNLRGEIATEIIDSYGVIDHFVYVECGKLTNSMFKLNLEPNGDQ